MSDIEFLIVLLLGAAGLVRLADLVAVPYPIVLVLGGLGLGLVPGLPDVELAPAVVFLVFLPPLLHAAGFYASPQELRAEKGALAFHSIGLVLLTMAAVAVAAHELIDGLTWTEAFLLGAIVGPTDPVSAAATFARMGVPERVKLVVEGEAMLNDATALAAYRVLLTAAASGTFVLGDALLEFVVAAAGGLAIGLAVGWLEVRLLQRQEDTTLAIFLTVAAAYGAYIAAEKAHVSGVLAAVVSGLYLGWNSHRAFEADARLSGQAFWQVLVFGLNAMLFILLGLQFPSLLDEIRREVSVGSLTGSALVVSGVVVAVRVAADFLPGAFPGADRRERIVVSWSGMRGAISLAAALSIDLSVNGRPQIIFVTFVVIFVTLVGQGLTLPAVMRALRMRGPRPWSADEAIARLEAAQAALERLDELEEEGIADEELLRRLRDLYRARFRACLAVIGQDGDTRPREEEPLRRYGDLRRELIAVERATLLRLRNSGRVRNDTLRKVLRDLDLEEARLRR